MTGKSKPWHPNRKYYRCQTGENLTDILIHILMTLVKSPLARNVLYDLRGCVTTLLK